MENKTKLKGIIEAILFTIGESVTLDRLASVLEKDPEDLKVILEEMKIDYSAEERGICLIELDGAYQICTKIETYDYVRKLVSQPKKRSLTDVMLETLSIIAYKQPVTKQEIEAIRGVKCDFAVNKLITFHINNLNDTSIQGKLIKRLIYSDFKKEKSKPYEEITKIKTVAFNKEIKESDAEIANAIASSISDLLMNGNYKDMPYSLNSYNWVKDPDGDNYLFNVSMGSYNSIDNTQNLSDKELEKVNKAVQTAFDGLTPADSGMYDGGSDNVTTSTTDIDGMTKEQSVENGAVIGGTDAMEEPVVGE